MHYTLIHLTHWCTHWHTHWCIIHLTIAKLSLEKHLFFFQTCNSEDDGEEEKDDGEEDNVYGLTTLIKLVQNDKVNYVQVYI